MSRCKFHERLFTRSYVDGLAGGRKCGILAFESVGSWLAAESMFPQGLVCPVVTIPAIRCLATEGSLNNDLFCFKNPYVI